MGWRSYTLWPAGVELPHAHYWHNPTTGETTWEMPEQVCICQGSVSQQNINSIRI